MGKFVVTTRKNGDYQFDLKAGNGQVILTSQGYAAKPGCLNGIESVRKNAAEDSRFDLLTSSNGKFYFNLKSSNGQIIGTSEMYESETSRNAGVASVKSNAPQASVEDSTV